jgi:hypothetical protein
MTTSDDNIILYENGFEMVDGIERTAVNFRSECNGRICMFERDPVKNIVSITLYYGIMIDGGNFCEVNVVVPFENIRADTEISILYDMSQMLTKDAKKMIRDNSMHCFNLSGRAIWNGKYIDESSNPISFVFDYGKDWNDVIVDENLIKQKLDCIISLFNGPFRKSLVYSLIGLVIDHNILMLEKEAEKISNDVKASYIAKNGLDAVGQIFEDIDPQSDISKDIQNIIMKFM